MCAQNSKFQKFPGGQFFRMKIAAARTFKDNLYSNKLAAIVWSGQYLLAMRFKILIMLYLNFCILHFQIGFLYVCLALREFRAILEYRFINRISLGTRQICSLKLASAFHSEKAAKCFMKQLPSLLVTLSFYQFISLHRDPR